MFYHSGGQCALLCCSGSLTDKNTERLENLVKKAGWTHADLRGGGAERSNGQKQTPCPQPPAATEEQLQRKTFRQSRTGQEQELFDVTGTLGTSQPDVPSPLLLFHLRAETGSCLLLNDPLTQATFLNTTTKTFHATSALHMVIYSIRIIYSSSFPGLEQSFTMLDEVIFRVTLQLESFLK